MTVRNDRLAGGRALPSRRGRGRRPAPEVRADILRTVGHILLTDGQIRPGTDVRVLVDQLWGAVYHRILIPDEPVTDQFITALITNLMDGITPAPS